MTVAPKPAETSPISVARLLTSMLIWGAKPAFLAQREEVLVEAGAVDRPVHHQRLPREVGDGGIRLAPRKMMILAHSQQHVLFDQAMRDHAVRQQRGVEGADDADVDLPLFDLLDLRIARQFVKSQFDQRVSLPITVERACDARHERRGGGKAERQPPKLAPMRKTGRARRAFGLRQSRAGFGEKQSARFRQPDTATGPVEQPRAEFRLERPDLLAERRLRNRQALGRATEMHFLRHADEIAQMPEVHRRSIPIMYRSCHIRYWTRNDAATKAKKE